MRKAEINRKTKETEIAVKLNIDGIGKTKINTGIGLLNHMLELFAFWGYFDLDISAKGDLNVDIHHTNEDIGIVLGQAFKEALGDKKGIRRIGFASVPMEEVVAAVTLDISGRGFFNFDLLPKSLLGATSIPEAFAKQLGMNLNIKVDYANPDLHATLEPIFKALGIALDLATQIDPRRKGVPSTKGVID
jgi:imidazoleglycerol-phosphate dehydratase